MVTTTIGRPLKIVTFIIPVAGDIIQPLRDGQKHHQPQHRLSEYPERLQRSHRTFDVDACLWLGWSLIIMIA